MKGAKNKMKKNYQKKIIENFKKMDKYGVKYRHYSNIFLVGILIGLLIFYFFGMYIIKYKFLEEFNKPVIKELQLDFISIIIKEGNDTLNFTLENFTLKYDKTKLNKLTLNVFNEEGSEGSFLEPDLEIPFDKY